MVPSAMNPNEKADALLPSFGKQTGHLCFDCCRCVAHVVHRVCWQSLMRITGVMYRSHLQHWFSGFPIVIKDQMQYA